MPKRPKKGKFEHYRLIPYILKRPTENQQPQQQFVHLNYLWLQGGNCKYFLWLKWRSPPEKCPLKLEVLNTISSPRRCVWHHHEQPRDPDQYNRSVGRISQRLQGPDRFHRTFGRVDYPKLEVSWFLDGHRFCETSPFPKKRHRNSGNIWHLHIFSILHNWRSHPFHKY